MCAPVFVYLHLFCLPNQVTHLGLVSVGAQGGRAGTAPVLDSGKKDKFGIIVANIRLCVCVCVCVCSWNSRGGVGIEPHAFYAQLFPDIILDHRSLQEMRGPQTP